MIFFGKVNLGEIFAERHAPDSEMFSVREIGNHETRKMFDVTYI